MLSPQAKFALRNSGMAAAALFFASAPAQAATPALDCGALAHAALPGARIVSSTTVAAGALKLGGWVNQRL